MSLSHLGQRVTVRLGTVTSALALLLIVVISSLSTPVSACPFCGGVTRTLAEEMDSSVAVVLARIVPSENDDETATAANGDGVAVPAVQPKTKFRIEKILKGEDKLADGDGENASEIEVLFFGQPKPEAVYLVMGIDGPSLEWSTPIVLTDEGVAYVSELLDLPAQGGDRLAYFQEYFEHADPMLAQDSYDEFARAPYGEVKELRERMDHDKLVSWINNTEVISSRRRLYLTLLGICGSGDDVPMLDEMIRSDDRATKTALDALIACYLTLAGNDGLPLVEELFLANQDAEYTDTYAAIMALRFHGQEDTTIDRERLLAAMRLMLDRPTLADLVIPDLARWEDWSVAGRLVTLFKEADTESSWVRVPVIHYLRALNNKIEADLKELAEIDPDAYKRANTFFPIQSAAKPAPPATAVAAADATDTASVATASVDAAPTDTTNTAANDETSETSAVDTTTADSDSKGSDSTESTDTSDAAAAANDGADVPVTTSQAGPPTADALAADAVAEDTLVADVVVADTVVADTVIADAVTNETGTDNAEAAGSKTAETATEPSAVPVEAGEIVVTNTIEPTAASGSDDMPLVSWARMIVILPAIGVLLFAVFAVLLLGGRHSSQQG